MHIRILSLSSTGSALIATQIPWFTFSSFLSPVSLEDIALSLEEERGEPTPTTLSPPSISETPKEVTSRSPESPQKPKSPSSPQKKKRENMNGWTPDTFLENTYEAKKGDYLEKSIESESNTLMLKISKNPDESIYLSSIGKPDSEKVKFDLFFETYEDEYENFPTGDINISLFTKPAWKSQNMKEDEYNTKLTQEEISELFTLGLDNKKLKQLLLSLSSKRSWKAKQNQWKDKYFYDSENWGWMRPNKLDNLKDLKINYFFNFQELREYIQKKSKVCINDKKSCIADKKELTFFDYNEYSFFNKEDGTRTK